MTRQQQPLHTSPPATNSQDSSQIYPWMTVRNENDREKRLAMDKFQLSQLNKSGGMTSANGGATSQDSAATKRAGSNHHQFIPRPYNPLAAQEVEEKFRRAQYRIGQRERLKNSYAS